MAPKISLVIPCFNVEKYVRQCVESAQAQTLSDIEIICVNDGSTDGTLAVLQDLAAADPRIKILDKPNEGYGKTMNRGFDMATGEYIGILESDDFIDADMLADHYEAAKANDAEVVKSNFFFYWSTPEERDEFSGLIPPEMCGKVMAPLDDERLFHVKPTIWSAIYRADFIRGNNIRFNETPGASYQDASFNFQVWAYATRVVLLERAYLHYRQDNEASSVNSPGKVYCVCDEYEKIGEVLESIAEKDPAKAQALQDVVMKLKFDSYMWNYLRLTEPLRREFIGRWSEEFKAHERDGLIKDEKFEWYNLRDMRMIIDDPLFFHELHYEGPKVGKVNTVMRFVRAGGWPYFKKLLAHKRES